MERRTFIMRSVLGSILAGVLLAVSVVPAAATSHILAEVTLTIVKPGNNTASDRFEMAQPSLVAVSVPSNNITSDLYIALVRTERGKSETVFSEELYGTTGCWNVDLAEGKYKLYVGTNADRTQKGESALAQVDTEGCP